MGDRVILHCDLNCFFASVELLSHPDLRDIPTAVCGDPASRHVSTRYRTVMGLSGCPASLPMASRESLPHQRCPDDSDAKRQ